MATINMYSVPPVTTGLTPLQRFKSHVVRWLMHNPLFGLCFTSDEEHHFLLDRRIRADISESMRTHYVNDVYDAEGNVDDIASAVEDVYSATGYDLGGQSRDQPRILGTEPMMFGTVPSDLPLVVRAPVHQHVQVIPRFAGACVAVLRSRLGVLGRTSANLLLVQREYLRLCRRRGVRAHDIVSHQLHVMNAFFTDDVYDRVAQTRRRIPAWLRWAYPWNDTDVSLSVQ